MLKAEVNHLIKDIEASHLWFVGEVTLVVQQRLTDVLVKIAPTQADPAIFPSLNEGKVAGVVAAPNDKALIGAHLKDLAVDLNLPLSSKDKVDDIVLKGGVVILAELIILLKAAFIQS